MKKISLNEADWYLGTTLSERAASRNFSRASQTFSDKLAEHRLHRWRSQFPFQDPAIWASRLLSDHLTEREFETLLGERAEAVAARFSQMPDWVISLETILNAPNFEFPNATDAPLTLTEETRIACIATTTLVSYGMRQLRDGIRKLHRRFEFVPINEEKMVNGLGWELATQLEGMLRRVFVLEINAARIQGRLRGDTPQDRYRSFFEDLRDPVALSQLFKEYPVVARQLVIRLTQWIHAQMEVLERLTSDWSALCQTMFPDQQRNLAIGFEHHTGDRHHDGRATRIINFSDGSKLVYKPRSMAMDVHAQELFAWLNAKGCQPQLLITPVLDRQTHGWMRFLPALPCTSKDEVERFFERQGSFLALLYALEGTDFHQENIIAHGEYPVLIDLETLFMSHLPVPSSGDTETRNAMMAPFEHSVLRIGLLPSKILGDQGALDVSALGGEKGQLTPVAIPSIQAGGTDHVRIERRQMPLPPSENLPTLHGETLHVADYHASILNGFERMYRLLVTCRDDLLSETGPIQAFSRDSIRIVLRATNIYAQILHESGHPDLLRNAVERERHLDLLWARTIDMPFLIDAIPFEIRAIQRNDVPYFSSKVDSKDLFIDGKIELEQFLPLTGLETVKQRIQRMCEHDLAQQRWYVRASLATTSMAVRDDVARSYSLPQRSLNSDDAIVRSRCLDLAIRVGETLSLMVSRSGNKVSWMGLTLQASRHWMLMPCGYDFYNGLPGIALYLAYLGQETQDRSILALAERTIDTFCQDPSFYNNVDQPIGVFEGIGGCLYMLVHAAKVLERPEYLAIALKLTQSTESAFARDEHCDVMSGSAGAIVALLNLYDATRSEYVLNLATQCGNRLLKQAIPQDCGIAWTLPHLPSRQPMTGMSHGASGMALAFAKLSTTAGEPRFARAAIDAIAYERSCYSDSLHNWMDFRILPGSPTQTETSSSMTTWCHGAPGVGLSRIALLTDIRSDSDLISEIRNAAETTSKLGFGYNHCLCHGDLGNLEFLSVAANRLGDHALEQKCHHLRAQILDSIDEHGWLCGVPNQIETPGFMVGLSGIGYGLLRQHSPEHIPSILMLEAPR